MAGLGTRFSPAHSCKWLIASISKATVLLLLLCLLTIGQAQPTVPASASSSPCEQQVLAALGQQTAYDSRGYSLNLIWQPTFSSVWGSFGCLASLQHLTMTGALPQLPAAWANTSSFPLLQSMNFSNSILVGTLPPEWSRGAFPALLSVDLSNTELTGTLPAAWGSDGAFSRLVNLTLVGTRLGGTLPADWGTQGGWQALQQLEIGSCNVGGRLPAQWGSNSTAFPKLIGLSLQDMLLSGTLPEAWGSSSAFQRLQQLSISQTGISGAVPPSWAGPQAFPALRELILSSSPLGMSLPADFATPGAFPNLTLLHMQNSSITGNLPSSWIQPNAFPLLQHLLLNNNSLSGALPSNWSAALPAISRIDLSYTGIMGTLPSEWGGTNQFGKLTELVFDSSSISGTLPAAWGSTTAFPQLSYFSCMGCEQLGGALPPSWGGVGVLPQLQFVGIRNSAIGGDLPESWAAPGAMPSLTLMDLSRTALSGSIPAAWGNRDAFPSLTAIYINQSRMSGAMPAFHNAKLNIIIADSCNISGDLSQVFTSTAPLLATLMANNSITGNLPENSSALPMLGYLDLNGNQLQGTLPLSWLQPGQMVSHVNQINLGNIWSQSQKSVEWKRGLCLRADIYNAQLAYEKIQQVTGVIANMIIFPSYVLALSSQWGNVLSMFRAFSSQLVSVQAICSNDNAPTVLTGMWVAFAGIVIINLILYEVFRHKKKHNPAFSPIWTRCWARAQKFKFRHTVDYLFDAIAPLVELVLYYNDLIAAAIVLSHVWDTWPGYTLLGIFLFHFALTGGIVIFHSMTVWMDNWRFAPNPSRRFVLHVIVAVIFSPLSIPVVLFLDTVALFREISIALIKLAAIPSCSRPRAEKIRARLNTCTCIYLGFTWLDIDGYEDMHNIVATCFQTTPTIILNSIVFALGNKPSHGIFFSDSLFIECMTAAYLQMLKSLMLYLWAAYNEGEHVSIYMVKVMTGNFVLKKPHDTKPPKNQTPLHGAPLEFGDRSSSTQQLVNQSPSDAFPYTHSGMSRESSLEPSPFNVA